MLIGTYRANTIRKNKILQQVKSFLNREVSHHRLSLSKGVGFGWASLKEYRHVFDWIYAAENKLKGDCLISWEGVEWKSLVSLLLKIDHNPIKQRGVLSLSLSFMPLLAELQLKNCEIKAVGMKYLVKAELKGLRKLAVGFNRLDEGGAAHLSSSNWPNLQQLSLNGCHIQTSGLKRLLRGNWPRLHTLILDENKLSLQGMTLLCLGPWHSLYSLGINFNLLSPREQSSSRVFLLQCYPRVSLSKARRYV